MGNMFKTPKAQTVQAAAAPAAAAPALPQEDSEELRRTRLRRIGELTGDDSSSGTGLTESRLGDYSKAVTRMGAMPSSIVTG
jgi:hypothetical protein